MDFKQNVKTCCVCKNSYGERHVGHHVEQPTGLVEWYCSKECARGEVKVIHIVGRPLRVQGVMRQVCSWCGEKLIDYDLECIATSDGADPGFWSEGDLLEVSGTNPVSYVVVQHQDGAALPAGSCALRPLRAVR